jgi:hypothetical protein
MRRISFLLAGLFLINIAANSQVTNKHHWDGIWTEKQNGISSIQWLFEGNDDFAEISYWANGQELGGLARKGKFTIDTLANTIKLNFYTTINIKDNTFNKDNNDSQEWKIISVSNDEIVISRPPLWKNEQQNKSGDGKNVLVTLVRLTKPSQKTVALH